MNTVEIIATVAIIVIAMTFVTTEVLVYRTHRKGNCK